MSTTTITRSSDHDIESDATGVEPVTRPHAGVADPDISPARPGRTTRSRRRAGLVAAAVAMFAALLFTAAPAGAVATASTGASAHSSGFCGGRTATVTTTRTQFEWRWVQIYVNGRYYSGSSNWELLSLHSSKSGVYLANSQASILVHYADDLGGGRYAYASEWVRFSNGTYYCIAM